MASEPSSLVGTTTAVPPGDLNPYHDNPRRGDVEAIMGSLTVNGQFAPIIANVGTFTGRPNEVLAGNHTLEAVKRLAGNNPFGTSWKSIKVHWVDVDDTAATKIVVADNRVHDMGDGYDDGVVYELLKQAGTTGTGYTDEALDALEAAFDKTADDAEDGEPTPPSLPDRPPSAIGFTIIFDDLAQQEAWFGFLKWLRTQYPNDDLTAAERVVEHLNDTSGERGVA